MPHVYFDKQTVRVSAAGYAEYQRRCHTAGYPEARQDALLDLLYDEGRLCDVCGNALATTRAIHGDIRLCQACVLNEPRESWFMEEA